MGLFKTENEFIRACENKDYKTVARYLRADAKTYLAALNKYKETPLYVAVDRNNYDLAKMLLDAGASPNQQENYSKTPLTLAIRGNDPAMVSLLLAKGADIEAPYDGETPLQIAIDYNRTNIVPLLIDAGADPNNRLNGQPPILMALQSRRSSIIETLFATGTVSPNTVYNGKTLLSYAVETGDEDVLDLVVKAGAVYDSVLDKDLLSYMLEYNRPSATIQKLITLGASPQAVAGIKHLITHKSLGRLKEMVALGADLKKLPGISLDELLLLADSPNITAYLLEQGANINYTKDGQSCLHKAVLAKNIELITLLIEAGADLDCKNSDGQTPRRLANKQGNKKIIAYFNKLQRAAKAATVKCATPAERWEPLSPERTAWVGTYPSIGKKITHIFNFKARSMEHITDDLVTKAQSVIRENFDALDIATLDAALKAHLSFGGVAGNATPGPARRIQKNILQGQI